MSPHLSTIDGLILSVLAAEKYLIEEQIEVDNLFLASFEIKAGNQSIEKLMEIPLIFEKIMFDGETRLFTISLLGMIVTIKLKELVVKIKDKGSSSSESNYIATHIQNLRHNIFDIQLFNQKEIICQVSRSTNEVMQYKGINSGFKTTISLVEWLIIFSQMSQVVAYDYDVMDRKYSDTLWMRSIKAEIKEPYVYEPDGVIVTGGISKASSLVVANESWRLFNMEGQTADSHVKFSGKLAHKLPIKVGGKNG